ARRDDRYGEPVLQRERRREGYQGGREVVSDGRQGGRRERDVLPGERLRDGGRRRERPERGAEVVQEGRRPGGPFRPPVAGAPAQASTDAAGLGGSRGVVPGRGQAHGREAVPGGGRAVPQGGRRRPRGRDERPRVGVADRDGGRAGPEAGGGLVSQGE